MFLFYLLVFFMPVIRPPLLSRLMGEDAIFKFLGAVCVIYAIIHLMMRGALPRAKALQLKLFVIYFTWAVLSYLMFGLSFTPILSLGSMLMLVCVVLIVVDNEKRLLGTLTAMVAALVFASAYVIREWQVYHSIYTDLRASGITGDPNYFTASAILALPIAYYLVSRQSKRLLRWFCIFAIPVILLAVMFGASRGGLVGLGISVLIIVMRHKRKVLGLVSMTVVLALFLVLAPNSPLNRFFHPNYGDQVGVTSRQAAWNAGFRMIEAHPFFGVGIGNFKPMMPQYENPEEQFQQIAHNTYIEIAAEMGIPGLLIFLSMIVATLFSLQKVRKRAVQSDDFLMRSAAGALQSGIVGYLVAAVFLSAQYEKMIWLAIALSMVLPILQARASFAAENSEDGIVDRTFADAEAPVSGI